MTDFPGENYKMNGDNSIKFLINCIGPPGVVRQAMPGMQTPAWPSAEYRAGNAWRFDIS